MTVRHIFEISEDDHPRTVSHARDHWWTLDFANAFVSPGVNSQGELVPSPSARGKLETFTCFGATMQCRRQRITGYKLQCQCNWILLILILP
jgi:hypothetical protein